MTARIESFRDLEAWQAAMMLTLECYRLTRLFPADERFGLVAQVRRSAVSIPSNVAEGHNRRSLSAYRNHVGIALGSQAEVDTQLEIATRLEYVTIERWNATRPLLDSVGRLLHGLHRAL